VKKDALMGKVDNALARWPVRERPRRELDDTADRIASRAQAEASWGANSDLLRPPLPASMGERYGRVRAGWWTAGGIAAVAAVAASVLVGLHRDGANDAIRVALRPGPAASSPQTPARPSAVIDEPGIDPSDLPRAMGTDKRAPLPAAARPSGAPKGGPFEPNAGADLPKAGPGGGAGPSDPLQPAAAVAAGSGLSGELDSVPLKPPLGAVQSALGVAGRAARGCLLAGDAVSHATVTFRSDGSVSDVAVSGGAAGTPADSCIRAALSGARVPPFAEPSFAAPVTVRPN
jgi:hypothetical protein